jgi:hypothetical protein
VISGRRSTAAVATFFRFSQSPNARNSLRRFARIVAPGVCTGRASAIDSSLSGSRRRRGITFCRRRVDHIMDPARKVHAIALPAGDLVEKVGPGEIVDGPLGGWEGDVESFGDAGGCYVGGVED